MPVQDSLSGSISEQSLSIESTDREEEEIKPNVNSEGTLTDPNESYESDEQEADKLVTIEEQYILGMLSKNRELFLFDRQVKMGRRIENWLQNVEDAMRVSVKKHMKNAILRFADQPIEEWMLDYPQQIAISTVHLVISQEINDLLANTDFEGPDADQNASMGLFHEDKVTIGKPDPSIAKALANVGSEASARSKGSTASKKDERSS